MTHDLSTVAKMMDVYLDKFGIEKKMDAKEFAEKYFAGMEKKVLQGIRLALPLNLGYMQGMEHLYSGDNKNHLQKFGNLDYSVIWMKHPMFRYHKIQTDTALNDKLKRAKLKGVKVLDDYVDGDYFIVK